MRWYTPFKPIVSQMDKHPTLTTISFLGGFAAYIGLLISYLTTSDYAQSSYHSPPAMYRDIDGDGLEDKVYREFDHAVVGYHIGPIPLTYHKPADREQVAFGLLNGNGQLSYVTDSARQMRD